LGKFSTQAVFFTQLKYSILYKGWWI